MENTYKPKYDTTSDVDFYDIKSIIAYIINHYEKFLLLVLVVVIVYIIDHINNINTMIYGIAQMYPRVSSKKETKKKK